MWSLDVVGSSNPDEEVHRKIEELAWATAVIYGVSGWHEDSPFKANFVLYVSMFHQHVEAAKLLSIGCILSLHLFSSLLSAHISHLMSSKSS